MVHIWSCAVTFRRKDDDRQGQIIYSEDELWENSYMCSGIADAFIHDHVLKMDTDSSSIKSEARYTLALPYPSAAYVEKM